MGNLINFYSPSAANINSLKVHFAPKQNLNGQTKPWPAGGGKNILNMDWFTATNSYIGSTGATGTMAYYSYTDYLELAPNTYTISGINNTVNSNLRIHSYDENKVWVKQLASKYLAEGASFSLTFTITSDDKYIRISAPAHTPEDPLLQLEVGSTATAYVPYENICPIEGWGSVEAYITGENLVPPTVTTWYRTYPNGGKFWGANAYSSFAIPVPSGSLYINNQSRIVMYAMLTNALPISGTPVYSGVTMSSRNRHILDNSQGCKYLVLTVMRAKETQSTFITDANLSVYLIDKSTYTNYNGHTYPVEFPAVGKNLFDYTNTDNWRVAITSTERVTISSIGSISMDNNVVSLTRTHSYAGLTFILGRLEKDTQYCLSGTFTNIDNKAYIALLDNAITDDYTCTRKFTLSFSNGVVTFTPTQTGIYELLLWNSGTTTLSATQLQLEKASSATTYEPFNNTIYSGYVDLVEGKVVAENAIVDLGDFSWNSDSNRSGVFYASMSHVGRRVSSPIIACNKYEARNESVTTNQDAYISGYWSYSGAAPFIRDSRFANYTSTQVKEALVGTKAIIVLDTPLEYPISPQALQAFLGTNNIWSNTNSDTEISYDLYETSRLTTIKKRIIAAAPHVNTTSTANTVSFTTDMRAPLPQCKVSFAPRQGGSGTASPTNVRPIYGLKYLSVLNSGKNLIDVSTFTTGKGLNSSGQLQNWDSTMLSPYIPLPGGNYYVSAISRASGSNNLRIHGFDENKQWVKQIIAVTATQNAEYAGTFDFGSSNVKYIRVSVNINTENLQIEQGTTKSQYEPYSGGLWTADWESTAGEVYGGYVDLVSGEVWKTYGYISNITAFTGAFGPTAYGYSVYLVFNDGDHFIKTPICDRFMYSIAGYTSMPVYSFGGCSGASVTFTFTLDSTITSKEEADAWLANNPISVAYGLATPQLVTTLTPTQLLSFKGTNNLYASHNTITAKYWTH